MFVERDYLDAHYMVCAQIFVTIFSIFHFMLMMADI